MMLRNWTLVLVLIFLALQLLILHGAQAEYRVYRLGIRYDQSQPEQEVLTTLDDIQYMTYYKITPQQTTRIIQHWMCPGRTDGFKKYCPGPVAPGPSTLLPATAVRQPASRQAQSPTAAGKPANPPQQAVPVMIQ